MYKGPGYSIAIPDALGSYCSKDVTFLLKNVTGKVKEKSTEARELAIRANVHYSEMLPIEYQPTKEYLLLFAKTLTEQASHVAYNLGIMAEYILKGRGQDIVLVSLARAGTPIGILAKRYLRYKYGLDLPHFSISIIRGKGFDENAIHHILAKYPSNQLVFIDGWTGKGSITNELKHSCKEFNRRFGAKLVSDLAVIADPGYCANFFGTHEDLLIPSACLNATISGLISRTFHSKSVIGKNDFHGAVFYRELKDLDQSRFYIDTIAGFFPKVIGQIDSYIGSAKYQHHTADSPGFEGMRSVERIMAKYAIDDINLIKPGIGETTRVLLRRMPWKVLVRSNRFDNLDHIIRLACEKGVTVVRFDPMSYDCCGLIRNHHKVSKCAMKSPS